MQIQVIFDPGCPWCYIGKRQLERAIALRPAERIELYWWPFLLNPDLPSEGIERTTHLIRKFGSEARVSRVHAAIADVGQSVEIDFDFENIRRTPNTVNAHRLVRLASLNGRAELMVEALFFHHFVRGRDIGDLRVLVTIASELGLDPRTVRPYLAGEGDLSVIYAENARAHRLGINGVPAFVFNGNFVTCGAQEPVVLARMMDVAREAELCGWPSAQLSDDLDSCVEGRGIDDGTLRP
ncbi:MAG: DsbA family oxidoreductase [Defluviicoccus sp.]|nr:MAG: DsbA family oxidoreductase [Defluviicoccus sp.]